MRREGDFTMSCSFCGAKSILRAGRLRLCPQCEGQLVALRPESLAYFWYMRAVRRALGMR